MISSPPHWPRRFLKWFCNPDFIEEIEGDLHEIFHDKIGMRDLSYARRTFIFDVLKFFRWSNFKKPGMMKYSINKGLWKHNFKITMRVFKRNALYTGINISGLVLGICAFVILFLYHAQENSYDKSYPKHERIFRIAVNSIDDGHYLESAKSPIPLSGILKDAIPNLELTRMLPLAGYVRSEVNTRFKENQFVFAEDNIFDLFPHEVHLGSLEGALSAPFQVVITREKAIQYFGDTNPIGKTFEYEDEYNAHEFTVVAVLENFPENTHFHMDFIASYISLNQVMSWHNNWFYPTGYTYARLSSATEASQVREIAQGILEKNAVEGYVNKDPELIFQSIADIHLTSDRQGEWKPNNTQINIHFFLILGIFILLIAVINYINLTTANSQQRSKEIGIKKAMGSGKKQLIRQFFLESLVMVSLAIVISAGILAILWIPVISNLLNTGVVLQFLFSWQALIFLVAGTLMLSGIAGVYPAFTTTRFNPVDVIKNNLNRYMSKGSQRKILVTIQFSISMCLILCTILLARQYNYLQNRNTGFEKDYQVVLRMIDDHDKRNYHTLKEELLRLPAVDKVAVSNTVMGLGEGFYGFTVKLPGKPDLGQFEWYTLGVDEDYLETYGIQLLNGRDFDEEIGSDERGAFIINETAARSLGWENEEIPGKELELTIYTGRADSRKGKIIGVAEDFHYQSLYESVKPLIIYINKHHYYTDFLNIRLKPGNSILSQVKSLEKTYTTFNPNKPMEIIFVEDEIRRTYQRELSSSKLMTAFTMLSILIAALGVFGLATYTFRRRAKEIGVRKVLGASSGHITMVLIKEYLYLIILACIISWPLVHLFSGRWLDNFAYSISFGPLNYLLGLILVLLITLLSSAGQIMRSLKVNPVEHLRDE